ncbi:MAG: DHH family phosphoesterase, partial [Oscillospiraceae bacterium]|nr:DHH family phosphoesterase [Oscillospiraceae bacterium]
MDRLYEQENYEGVFIEPDTALHRVDKNTLLFIVDTHSPTFVESEELYRACKNVIVIDHHRKTVGHIDNAVIFFHEPFASSASEMVAELVQYLCEDNVLSRSEAEALLAGIMLDTKNFILKTGVRTFEAAAYLRKMGADTVEVKKLFANSIESYQR